MLLAVVFTRRRRPAQSARAAAAPLDPCLPVSAGCHLQHRHREQPIGASADRWSRASSWRPSPDRAATRSAGGGSRWIGTIDMIALFFKAIYIAPWTLIARTSRDLHAAITGGQLKVSFFFGKSNRMASYIWRIFRTFCTSLISESTVEIYAKQFKSVCSCWRVWKRQN